MAVRLKTLDRETPLLLPPDLRDWVPSNHIVHFVIDAVNQLPPDLFQFNHRGTGRRPVSPTHDARIAHLLLCNRTLFLADN